MKSGKIITGILVGAAAGAILGILFAPDKGSNTRKKIVDGTTDLKDSLKDKINEFVEAITDQYASAMDEANNVVEEGKQKYAKAKAEAKNAVS